MLSQSRPRGARHGKTEAQKQHFIAHNARRRCLKKKLEEIHDRFQRDSTYRAEEFERYRKIAFSHWTNQAEMHRSNSDQISEKHWQICTVSAVNLESDLNRFLSINTKNGIRRPLHPVLHGGSGMKTGGSHFLCCSKICHSWWQFATGLWSRSSGSTVVPAKTDEWTEEVRAHCECCYHDKEETSERRSGDRRVALLELWTEHPRTSHFLVFHRTHFNVARDSGSRCLARTSSMYHPHDVVVLKLFDPPLCTLHRLSSSFSLSWSSSSSSMRVGSMRTPMCTSANEELGTLAENNPLTDIDDNGRIIRSLDALRPLTLCNCDGKLLTSAICRGLHWYTMRRFRPSQRCISSGQMTDNIFEIETTALAHVACAPQESGVLLTDFAAVYPSVNHSWIFSVLENTGLPGFIFRFLRSVHSDSITHVEFAGATWGQVLMTSGVRQGCPASGFLFAMAFDPVFRWLQEAVIPIAAYPMCLRWRLRCCIILVSGV